MVSNDRGYMQIYPVTNFTEVSKNFFDRPVLTFLVVV